MVAAWMRAETGVGPSIASGSQVCSRNCADLPIAPMNSSRQAMRQRVPVDAPQMDGLARHARRGGEDLLEADRAGQREQQEDAEREAEVADPVDDEGLDRRGVGRRPLVPEADQQIGGEADAFPAEEHLHQIVGRHQHQHGEGEQRQKGEEARPARVLGHVADRIEVDDERDGADHHQHHRGQHVDAQRPGDDELAGGQPVGDRDDQRLLVVAERDREERDPGEQPR